MSRGPGAVERSIEKLFLAIPYLEFSVEDLIMHVYGAEPTKSRRVSVIRAANKISERLGWIGVTSFSRRSRTYFRGEA